MDSHKLAILCLALGLFAMTRADGEARIYPNNGNNVKVFKPQLEAPQSVNFQTFNRLNTLPYVSGPVGGSITVNKPSLSISGGAEKLLALPYVSGSKNVGGSITVNKPSLSISGGAEKLLAAPVMALRLVEAFLTLKAELVNYFLAIYNDNWEIIRAVSNFIVAKVPKFNGLLLAGVGTLRNVLEIATRAFSEWSVNLPSINVEGFKNTLVRPHQTYGAPSISNVANFLERFTNK